MMTRVSARKVLDNPLPNLKNQVNYERDSTTERLVRAASHHFLEESTDIIFRRQGRSDRGIRSAGSCHYIRDQASVDHSAVEIRSGEKSQSSEIFARQHLCTRRLHVSVLRQKVSFRGPDIRSRRACGAGRTEA